MVKKRGKRPHFWRNTALIVAIAFFFGSGVAFLWAANLKIPDSSAFEERRVSQSTKIYDRTGEVLLYDIHENIQRTVVPYEDISHHIKNATVAIEDAEFYDHVGIRPLATFRAVFIQPLRGKGVQGGSTITQQVVKNSLLTSERKISRKLKEWVLALKLEQIMSKEEILTQYLNEAPYGGNIYGIEEATRVFFEKNANDVTLAEAAYLAALPQAPTYYSPYGNNQKELEERKNLVLERMKGLGFISEEEYEEAKNEKVDFIPRADKGIRAPHFVFFIQSYLEQQYGRDAVLQEGLNITTTLDYRLQEKAEEILKEYALENEENFNASNAGLVAIDPKTGQILAMVGSRDYFDENIDGNFNITLAHRQPGSAFKPFVYATAFKKGYTPDTVVFDLETQFQTTCTPEGDPINANTNPDECYTPSNYDNIFRGPMSLRNALAQSVNVPAIKTLYLAGLSDSLQTAKDFGITSLTNINQYGLTLVLGGGEVSLLELTNAYGVFGNKGIRNNHTGILKVEDNNGNVLEEFSPFPQRVIEENVALQISDVLSDNDARAPAFGQDSYLHFANRDVAVKTGTTNDYRDAWILGYTPYLAVGTWAGNNDNSSMEKKVAGFIVAPMWRAFMDEALTLYSDESFKKPAPVDENIKPILRGVWTGGKTYFVDRISGKLATEHTPEETKEERVVIDIHNILHWVDTDDPLGPYPENPSQDPQYSLWEYAVARWTQSQGIMSQSEDIIPTETDDIHLPELSPRIQINQPADNSFYSKSNKIFVFIESNGQHPLSSVDFFINDVFVGSSSQAPFNFSFVPNDIESIKEQNTLKVVGYDSVFNKGEATVHFTVR